MGEMPVNSGKIAGTTYIYDEARRLITKIIDKEVKGLLNLDGLSYDSRLF